MQNLERTHSIEKTIQILSVPRTKEQQQQPPPAITTRMTNIKQGMDFVEQFKQARIQKVHKKMDWIRCLQEGTRLGLVQYINVNSLLKQFSKNTKQKRSVKYILLI